MSDERYMMLQALAGPVSRETFERLQGFESILLKWASRFNLVASSTIDSLWERHIFDSAQLLPLGSWAENWLDLGTGGGFPGAILAILLHDRTATKIDLVESNGKKAAFLRSALDQLGVSARVHKMRIADCGDRIAGVQIVTARALAPLPALMDLAHPWLSRGAHGLFQKGRDYAAEIKESRNHWHFGLVEHNDKVDRDAKIIEVSDVQRRHDRPRA